MRLIGVAVAHPAVRAAARSGHLAIWPTGYRTGLVEGLFLDREGYVDVSAWDAEAAAAVIAPVPAAGQVMQELVDKVGEAGWAYRLANDPAARDDTAAVMHGALAVLPDSARDAWGLGHHTPKARTRAAGKRSRTSSRTRGRSTTPHR